jgi:hypothetical protein
MAKPDIVFLSPSKQKLNKKKIYGFDIETADNNKTFILASIWSENFKRTYMTKMEFIDDCLSGRFNDSIIVATNLGFDFFGTLFGSDLSGFDFIFRGSSLIYAKTFVYNGKFNRHSNHHKTGITFLDTLNYASMSVEKLGKIIGVDKLESPKNLGEQPKDEIELNYLKEYNLRDSEVSATALKFLYKSFESLGATAKLTLASTSMSLFKNKYLKDHYCRHDVPTLLKIFESYYGGRTEAFCRGKIKDLNYYDVNSLYPAMMTKSFPNPNTIRQNNIDSLEYIRLFDGCSKVALISPQTKIPLLPYRFDNKLLFPVGEFTSWYTNIELRRALELGYEIKKVYENIFYKENCFPFKQYVDDMFLLRKKFKSENSNMELIVKILMNSLYGKFAQKFLGRDNMVPFNHSQYELSKFKTFEVIGDFLRVTQDQQPTAFCVPIWSSYVTAYGRIELHKLILESNPVYVDTDSIMTKKDMPESTELGKLKLEMKITDGVIVKPKFYLINGIVKAKGIGHKLVMDDFYRIMASKEFTYTRFMKFKESIRRNMIPNEIIHILKKLDLEDNKRLWHQEFSMSSFQESDPRRISTSI